MFYRYDLKKQDGEDSLYLYFHMDLEFSNEMGQEILHDDIEKRVQDYIDEKNIPFHGNKVYLVSKGIVVKTLSLRKQHIKIEILDDKSDYANIKYKVKIKKDGHIKEIYLKDFLLSVLFTNCMYDLDIEVLKALCVLYRTYTFYKMEKDGYLDSFDSFMKYRPSSYYKLLVSQDYEEISQKFQRAILKTDCTFMAYKDQYIMPYIHHTNNGYTDDDSMIPYLEKKYSLWDLLSPNYLHVVTYSYPKLERLLGVSKKDLQTIQILELSHGNRVQKIKVGEKIFAGEEFRKQLQLRSTDITVLVNDEMIKFITRGYGHGLGLSISGSIELAHSGCNYLQILNYYFSKCHIKKYV